MVGSFLAILLATSTTSVPVEPGAGHPSSDGRDLEAGDQCFIPYFEVDTTSGQGETTLFGVANGPTDETVVEIEYFAEGEGATPPA